jgi:hypothetical protein
MIVKSGAKEQLELYLVGADIQNFTSSVAIDRSVNWLPRIADDRPDQRPPIP